MIVASSVLNGQYLKVKVKNAVAKLLTALEGSFIKSAARLEL